METSPHRERYRQLIERRRALLEFERVAERIEDHPLWHEAQRSTPELHGAIDRHRESLGCDLCTRACRAGADVLACDVRRIYRGLVALCRLWVALEERRPVTGLWSDADGAVR
jgi:hypothetical protein